MYMDQQALSNQLYSFTTQSNYTGIPVSISRDNSSYTANQPRPSILRKLPRASDNDLKYSSENGVSSNDTGNFNSKDKLSNKNSIIKASTITVPNDPYIFIDSPRKKPRKQAVIVNEDMFPIHMQSETKLSAPYSNITKIWPTTQAIKQMPEVKEDVSFPPRKRMSLLKAHPPTVRTVTHFESYSDVKPKKKKTSITFPDTKSVMASGWRLYHLKSQLDEVSFIQKETKNKICEYKDFFGSVSDVEDKCSANETLSDIIQAINQHCQTNLTLNKQILASIDKLISGHKARVVELVKEHRPELKTPYPTLKNDSLLPSGIKKTRKRKT